MKRLHSIASKLLRTASISIVVLLGVTTIIASNFNGPSNTNPTPDPSNSKSVFKEISVYPTKRCPGTDVRAHWVTSPAKNIIIKLAGQTIEKGPRGDYVFMGQDLDSHQNIVEVEFRIDCNDCDVKKFKIQTSRGMDYYKSFGASLRDVNYRYRVILPPKEWDDKLVTHNIELSKPKIYTCSNSLTEHNLNWHYNKGRDSSGFLNKENGFRESFSRTIQTSGDWYFSISSPDNEYTCPGWELNTYNPSIIFGVSCQ